ncbi:MAG TPA: Ig-like domain-containing protein [Myxococcales bacterium]|nr:Ig-like domain-containing protein [Myxococcales bacterium]
MPAYTNDAALQVDASVGDGLPVQSVAIVVQGRQGVARFAAAPVGSGSDGGFAGGGSDAGLPSDGGFAGGGSDAGFAGDGGIQSSAWSAFVTLFEGPNSVTAVATDVGGSTVASAPQTITLDSAAPAVQVISPAPGQIFSNTQVDVNLIVSDATPTTVLITSPAGTATITPDPAGTVTTVANFPDAGASTLQIAATDSAANTTSLSVPVFMDLAAPILGTTLPDGQQSAALPGDAFPWTVSVADVAQVTLAFSPGNSVLSIGRGGGVATASLPVVDGINLFQVTATSESGHVATLQRTFTYDTTPPTGSIDVPQAGERLHGIVELTAAAQDALTGVASVEIGVDSPGAFAAPAGNGLWIAPFDTRAIADGEHTAVATLTDAVGNKATLTQAFLSDNTPPQVAIAAPAGGAYVGGSATVTATAQDATTGIARIDVLVDGQPVGSCAASPCSIVYDSATHADGPALISARATDGAGNPAVSAAVAVTIDNSAPSGFLTSPADGAVVGASLVVAVDVNDADFASGSCLAGAIPIGPFSTPAFSATVDLSGVLDGPLAVSCTARDLAGNEGTQAAGVTVRKWLLDVVPSVIVLRAGGGGTAGVHVSGPGAELLTGIVQRLSLAIPGGPTVPVASAAGGPGETILRVDRAALIGSLRASVVAGALAPPATVQISLRDGAVERGRATVQVR